MRRLLIYLLLLLPVAGSAQPTEIVKANYQLAARFSPKKLEKMVFSLTVDPHWLKKSDRFWYAYETTEGKKWFIVDPAKAQKQPLFDNDLLASAISAIVREPFEARHLGLDSLRFLSDENLVRFQVKSTQEIIRKDTSAKKGVAPAKQNKVYQLEYDLLSKKLKEITDSTKTGRKPRWANISPDGKLVVFGKRFNLYWMDRIDYVKALENENDSSIIEHQLTTDGVAYFSYHDDGVAGASENNVDKEKNKDKRKPATLFWSPDSRYFSLVRTDERNVKELWVINSLSEPRPTLETYKYEMPGEKETPVDHLQLFDMKDKTNREIAANAFKDQSISLWVAPTPAAAADDPYTPQQWHGTAGKFYFSRTSRDLKRIDECIADVATATIKTLAEERLFTYVEVRRPGLVNGGKELIEWSERDGWAHFYLYDENGNLKNQVTSGAWHCEDIVHIDEKKRILYFTANGKEPGEDPYFLHLYKVNFDGSGLKLLNPGDMDHVSSMNDGQQYFVDNFSRVNTIPRSVLYNSDGGKIMDLETADLSQLFGAGYKFPQPFKVKADDGITDLFGVMYKPFNFDSTRKYPVIEYVYPGPQTEAVNKSFNRRMDRTDRLAQLGFLVVTVGNRGGHPGRSKWYHNFGYGNLRDYGLADKKTAAEQLADRYPYFDINRVGIHGHSGGGFMSTAAMLVYPDFFKVAVSSSGNHDNSIYNRWWSEKHHGVKEIIGEKNDTSFVYSIEKNPDLAKNLKGHLMLSTGDIDNNVHPANTTRLANALIKANKRFDLVTLPGQRHGYGDMVEYFFWKMADYFTQYLMKDTTERSVDMEEMNRDTEQTGPKR